MDKRYWIGIILIKGNGVVGLRALQEHFSDLTVAWQALVDALQSAGISLRIAEHVEQIHITIDLDTYSERITAQDIHVLIWDDDVCPACLNEIGQLPPVLYAHGKLIDEDSWAVAFIGTRRVSTYGCQVTEELATFLACNGVTAVSGLARGEFAITLQVTLNTSGRSLAVTGCGLDRIYPPENRQLTEQIIHSGALVSDYAPGISPECSNFPPRNRIISGLSTAVVVVEAGEISGALITAQFAVDQDREMFAVPDNIPALQIQGTNQLIQQRSHYPLLAAQDMLEVLNLPPITEPRAVRKALPLDAIEGKLMSVLSHEPVHADKIRNRTGLSIDWILATLVMLELAGLVRQVGGMNFVVIREEQSEYSVSKS